LKIGVHTISPSLKFCRQIHAALRLHSIDNIRYQNFINKGLRNSIKSCPAVQLRDNFDLYRRCSGFFFRFRLTIPFEDDLALGVQAHEHRISVLELTAQHPVR